MKVSKLIALLQEMQAAYGDIDVSAWPYDGQSGGYDPKPVIHTEKWGHWIEIDAECAE